MPAAALLRRRWPSTLPRRALASRISRFPPNNNRRRRLGEDQHTLRDSCARLASQQVKPFSISVGDTNLRALSLVRRRGTFAWTRVFPAGALAIGGFGRSRWRLRRTRRAI